MITVATKNPKAVLKAAEYWEVEIPMTTLNKYGSWEFGPDIDGTGKEMDDFYVKLWGRPGETFYAIMEWTSPEWKEWESEVTGDDEGTYDDIIKMLRDGVIKPSDIKS